MSQLRSSSLSHKDNPGDPNLTLNPDGTTSLLVDKSQVVGYQSGFWKPSIDTNQGANTWLVNGAASTSMSNWTATWSRIGQHVTLEWYLTFAGAGTVADTVQLHNLPYKLAAPTADWPANSLFVVHTGASYSGGIDLTQFNQFVSYMYTNADGSSISGTDPNGAVIFQLGQDDASGNTSSVLGNMITDSSLLIGNITYTTDDTTWTPINGATVS